MVTGPVAHKPASTSQQVGEFAVSPLLSDRICPDDADHSGCQSLALKLSANKLVLVVLVGTDWLSRSPTECVAVM